MANYGAGIARDNRTSYWNIESDDGSRVAQFNHDKFSEIVDYARVYYALPLSPTGLSPRVWLQGSVAELVGLSTPTNGTTPLAQQRLTDMVNNDMSVWHQLSEEELASSLTRLRNRMRDLKGSVEETRKKRLTARFV